MSNPQELLSQSRVMVAVGEKDQHQRTVNAWTMGALVLAGGLFASSVQAQEYRNNPYSSQSAYTHSQQVPQGIPATVVMVSGPRNGNSDYGYRQVQSTAGRAVRMLIDGLWSNNVSNDRLGVGYTLSNLGETMANSTMDGMRERRRSQSGQVTVTVEVQMNGEYQRYETVQPASIAVQANDKVLLVPDSYGNMTIVPQQRSVYGLRRVR